MDAIKDKESNCVMPGNYKLEDKYKWFECAKQYKNKAEEWNKTFKDQFAHKEDTLFV